MSDPMKELEEAVARLISPTTFQLRDELARAAPIEEYTGDHFPERDKAQAMADEQCGIAFDKARAVIPLVLEAAALLADEELENRRAEQKRDLLDNFLRGQINAALRIRDAIRAMGRRGEDR